MALSQYQLKCGIQNSIFMISYYKKQIKTNPSIFLKMYLKSKYKDYNRYSMLIKDKNWILKNAQIKS
tara:strand:- start:189 stop:389 length:201 start_codon:yes stop_codon:yes gene_type:complete